MSDVGRKIRALREALGWSQDDLASKLIRTQATISRWEDGQREPGLDDITALASALMVSADDLLGSHGPQAGLTVAEHRAMEMTAELWDQIAGQVIANGPAGDQDRRELAAHIHAIQHAVMAQAAARAHPALYRELGAGTVEAVAVAKP